MQTRFGGRSGGRPALVLSTVAALFGGESTTFAQPPAGFNRTVVAAGLTSPTAIDVAPDGRVFFVTQAGQVRVIQDDQLVGQPFADLSSATDGSGERGMLGIALDPGFSTNRYVYVYYCALAGGSHNRLSRLTASASSPNQMQPGSEVMLLDLPSLASLENPIYHMGGSVKFALDGSLLLAVGDHLNAALCQDLSSPIGKILRIDRSTGAPVASNPFYNAGDGISFRDYVYCWGLRNPYSTAVQPGTGRLFLNDVGFETWEEINDGASGANYGWPTTEGDFNQAAYPGLTRPFYVYHHHLGAECAITGGTFYNPTVVQFPPSYTNKYFYSEFCTGVIYALDLTTRAASVFIPDANYSTTMAVGPDGSMYYISRGDPGGGSPGIGLGTVVKIDYLSNAGPRITQQPADLLVSVGQPASFSVQAGGSGTLSYQWQRNGADMAGATGTSYTIASTTMGDNGASFRVRVTNPYGSILSNAAVLTVTTNRPPVVSVVQPPAGATYRGGDTINFQFSASDPETGPLPAQNVTWWVDFHHDQHTHPFIAPSAGVLQGSFVIPVFGETDTDVFYQIHVTAVDPIGLTATTTRDILPITADLTISANVPGLVFTLDGNPQSAPLTVHGVAGMVRRVVMPGIQVVNGQSQRFRVWADGGTDRVRDVTFPGTDTTLSAEYEPIVGMFLSDLPFAEDPVNGYGPPERDRSNGESDAGDGNPITIGGVVFEKGVGVHADSELAFNLDGRGDFFSATVGVDDEVNGGGSVVFQVWGDGVELYDSGVMDGMSGAAQVSVPVDGINQLRLVVTDAGDGITADHADWADALVVLQGGPAGPVSHYRMDEGTGSVVMDMTMLAWHGTRSAGATWAPGFIGRGSLRFDGASGDVTVPDATQLDPVGAVTIAAWVNAASWTGGDRRIVQKGGQYWLADIGDQLVWGVGGVGGVSAALPTTGAWHHVAGTYDGATLRLYLDGLQVAQGAGTGPVPGSAAPLVIGWRAGGAAGERFNGLIDDVRVYGRALAGQEVRDVAGVVQVNFQPALAPVVAGYRADVGAIYGPRQGGLSYGWNAAHNGVCFDRQINPDQRLDTVVLVHALGVWELGVADGTYEVSATVGDAAEGSTHTLNVEGAPMFNGVVTSPNQFFTRTRRVVVGDGRLTLDAGQSAEGATRLTYVTIGAVTPNACAPDVNGDGTVNSQDFFDFLAFFFAGDTRADYNSDGAVNSQDFFDFLGGFFAGCP